MSTQPHTDLRDDLPSPLGANLFATALAVAAAAALRMAPTAPDGYTGLVNAVAYALLLIAAMSVVAGLVSFLAGAGTPHTPERIAEPEERPVSRPAA